jgi:hypothetical protein
MSMGNDKAYSNIHIDITNHTGGSSVSIMTRFGNGEVKHFGSGSISVPLNSVDNIGVLITHLLKEIK